MSRTTDGAVTLLVVCGVVFGAYKAIAAMNEQAMLTTAKPSCVSFAKERDVFPKDHKVEAMDAWTKHDGRYAVVVLANPKHEPYQTQICVTSSYAVRIVSKLEEHVWY